MLRLYIANKNYSSWSLRPWVLMRQLGIAFEETLVPFGDPGQPSPFRAFSPSGRVPCLVDGDTVIWDSLAIVEYLAEGDARVWPADRLARAWARCAAAEMHAGFSDLRNVCPMSCGIRVRIDRVPPALARDVARIDELWCEGLARFGAGFLAGDAFTAVDAFFAPVVFRVQSYALALSAPASAYVARVLALAPMQAWYEAALAEAWRDKAHEAEATTAGVLLADHRRPASG